MMKTESFAFLILWNRRVLTSKDRRECEKLSEKSVKNVGELLFIAKFWRTSRFRSESVRATIPTYVSGTFTYLCVWKPNICRSCICIVPYCAFVIFNENHFGCITKTLGFSILFCHFCLDFALHIFRVRYFTQQREKKYWRLMIHKRW